MSIKKVTRYRLELEGGVPPEGDLHEKLIFESPEAAIRYATMVFEGYPLREEIRSFTHLGVMYQHKEEELIIFKSTRKYMLGVEGYEKEQIEIPTVTRECPIKTRKCKIPKKTTNTILHEGLEYTRDTTPAPIWSEWSFIDSPDSWSQFSVIPVQELRWVEDD